MNIGSLYNPIEPQLPKSDIYKRVFDWQKKCTYHIENMYKQFLSMRYGSVPDIGNLIEFYKERKITVTHVSSIKESYFIVRENGRKVFVIKFWDEYDVEHCRFDFCFLIEKFVKPRKKTTR